MTRKKKTTTAEPPDGEQLRMRYVRLDEVKRWDRNPKRHDVPGLIASFVENGFRDAPIYDETLGALVAGNGRATALDIMRNRGDDAPRGILADADGAWWVPVQFGIDATSATRAEAFGVTHNLLTVAGGDLGPRERAAIFDEDRYRALLGGLPEPDLETIRGADLDELRLLIDPPVPDFPQLDEGAADGVAMLKCPECGHEFAK